MRLVGRLESLNEFGSDSFVLVQNVELLLLKFEVHSTFLVHQLHCLAQGNSQLELTSSMTLQLNY